MGRSGSSKTKWAHAHAHGHGHAHTHTHTHTHAHEIAQQVQQAPSALGNSGGAAKMGHAPAGLPEAAAALYMALNADVEVRFFDRAGRLSSILWLVDFVGGGDR